MSHTKEQIDSNNIMNDFRKDAQEVNKIFKRMGARTKRKSLSLGRKVVRVDIAQNANNPKVHRVASRRADDPKILAYIAINDNNSFVRRVAVRRVDDKFILADIAQNANDPEVRRVASSKLDKLKICLSEKNLS